MAHVIAFDPAATAVKKAAPPPAPPKPRAKTFFAHARAAAARNEPKRQGALLRGRLN